jgi:hypothetical protein
MRTGHSLPLSKDSPEKEPILSTDRDGFWLPGGLLFIYLSGEKGFVYFDVRLAYDRPVAGRIARK